MEVKKQVHEFGPFYDDHSRILILGSFPSVKSREQQFYYGHPQNRFWAVLGRIYHEDVPRTLEEKQNFLRRNRIALWDVIESCEIAGSSDSSIRNAIPCDLRKIMQASPISRIYLNGGTAAKLYEKYWLGEDWSYRKLPSTSPANAAWSKGRLVEAWQIIRVVD